MSPHQPGNETPPVWALIVAALSLLLQAPADKHTRSDLAQSKGSLGKSGTRARTWRHHALGHSAQGLERHPLARLPQHTRAPGHLDCSRRDLLCSPGHLSRHRGTGCDLWPLCRPVEHWPASQRSFRGAAWRSDRGHRRSAHAPDLAAAKPIGLRLGLRSRGLAMERKRRHEGSL